MKKFFILVNLVILSFFFQLFQVNALSFDFDNKNFADLTNSEMATYQYSFVNSNYDKFACFDDTSRIYCVFGLSGDDLLFYDNNNGALYPQLYRNGSVLDYALYSSVQKSGVSQIVQPNFTVGYKNFINYTFKFSNFDIYNQNGELKFAKNFDFTPPTCEQCEVCEVCEECDASSEFPITKEEFYVLLVILSTLLLLLFFKWCFGDRRRKR